MAISWSAQQRSTVDEALKRHTVASSRCASAAAEILPPARELDPEACARKCEPVYGRYVHETYLWYYHVAVSAAKHHVDALTGPDGLDTATYLSRHWADTDAFSWSTLSSTQLQELST